MEEAHAVCDNFKEGEQWSVGAQEPLARLRILALWIHRSPQQRQKWNEVCKIINLSNKYIEYDVDTRWNSTFRMLDDALKARYQVDKFLQLQTDFPRFTTGDWSRLSQIHNILSKFNEFTLFVSEKKPQISLAVPIYYELHDLLDEASERKERFINLDEDISLAVKEGMKKYKKYYTLYGCF
jgi:tRNA uridine 5-carbamoylmethylation protein Kti12